MREATHYIPDWSTGYRFGHALTRCAALGLVIRLVPLHPHWVDARYWQSVAAIAATTCETCDGNGGDWASGDGCAACGGSGLARELREEA